MVKCFDWVVNKLAHCAIDIWLHFSLQKNVNHVLKIQQDARRNRNIFIIFFLPGSSALVNSARSQLDDFVCIFFLIIWSHQTPTMDPISVSHHHRNIPDAFSLRNSEICIVNPNIKVLLPPSTHSSNSSDFVSTSSLANHNRALQESNLSINAPVFIPTMPKSESDEIPVPTKKVNQIQRKRIVLPCYGTDFNIHQYIWQIDDNGNLIADFNERIPPPKFLKNFKSAICVPTQVNFVRAHGELFTDQLACQDTAIDVKVTTRDSRVQTTRDCAVQVEIENTFHRYNRQNLLNLINVKSSSSIPNLSEKVRKFINNNNSKTFLHDILEIANDSAFDSTFYLRKSISAISLTDKTSSVNGSMPHLRKSFSSPLNDSSGQLIRQFRSCLNKLSGDNFHAILKEMRSIKVTEDATIFKLVELLYEKAIREPMYASQYVKIVMAVKDDFVVMKNRKSFEDLAIAACEKNHADAKVKLCKVSHLSENCRDILRHELVGSMKFLAEMLENHILSLEFIVKIVQDLLDLNCVESIDPLCKLLELLREKNIFDDRIVAVLVRLNEIQKNFPTRLRFMIQSVLEKYRFKVKPTTCDLEEICKNEKPANSDSRRKQSKSSRGGHSRRFPRRKFWIHILYHNNDDKTV